MRRMRSSCNSDHVKSGCVHRRIRATAVAPRPGARVKRRASHEMPRRPTDDDYRDAYARETRGWTGLGRRHAHTSVGGDKGIVLVGGQLLRPAEKPDRRVIVGTWRTRKDWEAWHDDPQFTETRQRLEGLESSPSEHWWHDVVLDVRKAAAPSSPASQALPKRKAKGKAKSP